MTKKELLFAYCSWAKAPAAALPAPVPIANLDVYEDDSLVINRLFFLLPDISPGSVRCFFFFEENMFSKDAAGDLRFISSSFQRFYP